MAQRQGAEDTVVGVETGGLSEGAGDVVVAGVGQQHAPGVAGGPGGVGQAQGVAGVEVDDGGVQVRLEVAQVIVVVQRADRLPAAVGQAHDEHGSQRQTILEHLLGHRPMRVVGHQDHRAAVGQDAGDLVGFEVGVDGRGHRAQTGGGEEDLHPGKTVGQHHRHPAGFVNAHLAQPPRHPRGALDKASEGQRLAVAGGEGMVGMQVGGGFEQLTESKVSRHQRAPWRRRLAGRPQNLGARRGRPNRAPLTPEAEAGFGWEGARRERVLKPTGARLGSRGTLVEVRLRIREVRPSPWHLWRTHGWHLRGVVGRAGRGGHRPRRRQERLAGRDDPALRHNGIRVPGGFATTADAYREFLQPTGWTSRSASTGGAERRGAGAARGRRGHPPLCIRREWPEAIRRAIRDAYRELCRRYEATRTSTWRCAAAPPPRTCPRRASPGSRRPSSTSRGEEELLDACRRCYASLFTDRAISYREDQGLRPPAGRPVGRRAEDGALRPGRRRA